jgi:hypothetical protein
MTPKQFFDRMQDELQGMVWGATPNKIFGDQVFVVAELPMQQIARLRQTTAFLVDEGYINDHEHPGLMVQNFAITVFVDNVQSAFGEAVMLGANRATDTSKGAGILDIEYELTRKLLAIETLTSKAMLVEKSTPKAKFIKGNTPLIFRSFAGSILCGMY